MKRVIIMHPSTSLPVWPYQYLVELKPGRLLIVAILSDEFNWNDNIKKCYFTMNKEKLLLMHSQCGSCYS
jgi:hypothetical protein